MLGQIADYSRIVNPTPTDDYVRQRREAVEKLVTDESLSVETLEAFVAFAAFGLPSSRDQLHVVATEALIAAIQESQPSFPADVDATQLDLRLVAALVIGERLQSEPSDATNQYLASLVIAALWLQPSAQELHLAHLLKNLVELAKDVLHKASRAVRERRPWPDKSAVAIAGADHTTVAKSAQNAFDTLLEAVASNAKADREELEVLWWVFGARSARTGERFDSMSDGERALIAAIELSQRMLPPPLHTAHHLLSSLVSDEAQLPLKQLIEQVTRDTLSALVQEKGGVETVLESNACLLPLSWLAARLLASDLSPGWQQEFERKTKLSADTTAGLGAWTRQVFAECVVQRLALPLCSDSDDT